jgi:hypothetical protein
MMFVGAFPEYNCTLKPKQRLCSAFFHTILAVYFTGNIHGKLFRILLYFQLGVLLCHAANW